MWVWLHVPVGLLVALFGIAEAGRVGLSLGSATLVMRCLVAMALGAAVALHQRSPAAALALAWAACGIQVLTQTELMLVSIALVIVAYGVARYGRLVTVWLSAFSIPLGYVISAAYLTYLPGRGKEIVYLVEILGLYRLPHQGLRPEVIFALGATAPLVLPWLIGLALRMRDRAIASRLASRRQEQARLAAEEQRAQAQQVARLREEQARLARDVHDVVGHSLAVILAQAESGHYLPDDDPARLKQAMENIANSARNSLQDVRHILAETGGEAGAGAATNGELDRLIDDVREAGMAIHATVEGADRPLPPDLAVVAYRVLQEMLTNTLKHGRPGEPVYVNRHWGDGLTIEVTNTTLVNLGNPRTGSGVAGMRQRLASVGGSLSVTQTADAYTVRAWLPAAGRLRQPVLPGAHL
jgi:signal transduction histidine kinase